MLRRLSTLGLAALLGFVPAFSGDSPAQPHQQFPVFKGPERLLADTLVVAADDFVVDVYHNGAKIPDERRELVVEVFGATVERIKVDVRPGDWLVFNVVNDRMRWGGAAYFGVSGRAPTGLGFTTGLDSGRWSCCDDLGQVGQFIAERDRFADHRALPIAKPWTDGDSLMAQHANGWNGKPIWGGLRDTWIKFIAR